MRIYLSVDLEGIHGVVGSIQTQPGEAQYERAVALMHQESNAVIEGLIAGGATTITANDAHWDMKNLRSELIHTQCSIISGWQKPYSMVSGVQGCDAACFIGYHSRAGAAGVLSHTYRAKVFYEVKLNHRPVGETGLNAALAGWFGVPVALITGDDVVCKEAEDWLGPVPHVIVKRAISRYSAVLLPQKQVLAAVHKGAADAMRNPDSWRLFKPPSPSTITITLFDSVMADGAELIPLVKRVDERSVEVSHDEYPVIFKAMLAIGAIGASRLDQHF